MDWSKAPLLLVTAFLLIGGLTELGTPSTSEALISVGVFMLGIWATIEVQSWHQKLRIQWEEAHKANIGTEVVGLEDLLHKGEKEGL